MPDKRRKRLFTYLLMALTAAVFGLACCFNLARSPYERAAASLPAELKAAKAEGLALTPEDLIQTPRVADERNAALLYQQINLANITSTDEDVLTAVRKPHPTPAQRKAASAVILKAAPALLLAEKAADLPGCDFHRSWALGPDLPLPEYGVLRKLARVLAAKAAIQADSGYPEEALRSIRIGACITYHLGDEPILIPLLVRIAIERLRYPRCSAGRNMLAGASSSGPKSRVSRTTPRRNLGP